MANRTGLLSIDPSIHSLGWAWWRNPTKGGFEPNLSGIVRASNRSDNWLVNSHSQVYKLLETLENHRCGILESTELAVCELPIFFGSGGMVAVSSGSLQKLSLHVGMLTEALIQKGMQVELVPVNEWKGQLPKQVVINRIKNKFPKKCWKNYMADTWDAVGIGLWKLGVKL